MFHLANLLSNIQSGFMLRQLTVDVKRTKLNLEVLNLLQSEGFINGFSISNKRRNNICVFLKYNNDSSVLKGLKIISLPSKRIYVTYNDIIKKLVQSGLFVISTTSGLIISENYLTKSQVIPKIGGELLFQIIF